MMDKDTYEITVRAYGHMLGRALDQQSGVGFMLITVRVDSPALDIHSNLSPETRIKVLEEALQLCREANN